MGSSSAGGRGTLRRSSWLLQGTWGTLVAMDALTARQQQVLDLWLAGTTYKELATQLGISSETVNPHLRGIAKKLGAGGIGREKLREAVGRAA